MKKYFAKILLLTLVILVLGSIQMGAEAAEAKKPRFIVTLPGMLGDKSYNDSCKAGIDRAVAEFGVEVKYLQATTPADFESNNLAAAEGGYDLVIILSGQQRQAAEKVIPEYPDQKFGIIDFSLPNNPKNVSSMLFAANEGSFLAGAAAAMFTTHTQIDGVNPGKVIGWISGIETPLINDFYGGFKQGVAHIDPEVKILQAFAGSFTDPLKGKELALSQYEQGADIIMNVASATGIGILDAAGEQKKFAIGVDLNQDALKPGYILTSMLKNVDIAVYLFIKSMVEGTYAGGSRTYLDVAKGGVSLTDFSVFKEHWKDKFPQHIVDRCEELAKEIASGKIKVDEFPGVR